MGVVIARRFMYSARMILGIGLIVVFCLVSLPPQFSPIHIPGSDGTYSQNFQDVWVIEQSRRLAETDENWSRSKGYFLDIGAYHGSYCSNSKLLEVSLGWKGVCLEPFPSWFWGRKCSLVKKAISGSSEDGKVVSFEGEGQLRTRSSEQSPQKQSNKRKRKGGKVSLVSFKSLLEAERSPKFINFVSLDVEGAEVDALRDFPFGEYKVGIWIIEVQGFEWRHKRFKKIESILKKHGYEHVEVKHKGVDEYFVAREIYNSISKTKEWRVHPKTSFQC